MDLARAPHRTARKKGSGYENDSNALRNYWGLRYSALLADFRKGIRNFLGFIQITSQQKLNYAIVTKYYVLKCCIYLHYKY